MNILFLCDEYPPGRHGGIGTVVQLLARELVRQGKKVVVAGFYDWGYGEEDEFIDEGVQVYRFRRGLASRWWQKQDSFATRLAFALLNRTGLLQKDIEKSIKKYGAFLEDVIRRHNIQVVEMPDFQDYMRFVRTYIPFPALPAPVVVKLHGSHTYFITEANGIVPEHIRKMEHDLLMQADAVASVSKYTAEKTADYLDYPKEIEVLYNGINPPRNAYKGEKIKDRVIFTGTLIPKKGIYQLMKAWNIVNEQKPEATLWIYGKGPVDKIKGLLNNKAVKTVFFKGHVNRSELFEEMAKANMAVFPSYAECFALAPMEAMACGTAVIYTKRTSGAELVDDNENGMLVDPDNVQEIANKILNLMNSPEWCRMIAEKGKEKVLSDFNISTVAQQHVVFYRQVINKRK